MKDLNQLADELIGMLWQLIKWGFVLMFIGAFLSQLMDMEGAEAMKAGAGLIVLAGFVSMLRYPKGMSNAEQRKHFPKSHRAFTIVALVGVFMIVVGGLKYLWP